jgi:hypothetical protein
MTTAGVSLASISSIVIESVADSWAVARVVTLETGISAPS